MTRVAVAVEGWNAEAAIAFALAARRFASAVRLGTGSETANGKDDIEVLTLGPEPGDEIVLAVEGDDEKEAFSTLLARLLSAIERPEQVPAVALASDAGGRQRSRKAQTPVTSRRIRDNEVVVLDTIEEVAPVRPRRGRVPVDRCLRRDELVRADKPPAPRGKKQHRPKRKQTGAHKSTTKRSPHKRKK